MARCLQNYYIVYVWKNVSYTFLLLLFFFFEIRLTRGDVWAKTKVQDIRSFLYCNLGSYLIYIHITYMCNVHKQLNAVRPMYYVVILHPM